MFGFKRHYVVEIIHDNGGLTKVVLHYRKKKELEKQLEYYKKKAYWWEDLDGIMMIMRTNQPV